MKQSVHTKLLTLRTGGPFDFWGGGGRRREGVEDFEKENILQAHLYQKKSMHKTNASPDKNNIQTRLVSQKALHGKKITTSPGGKICSAWNGGEG